MCRQVRGMLRRYAPSLVVVLAAALLARYPSLLDPLAETYVRACARLAGYWRDHHAPPYVVAVIALVLIASASLLGVALLRELAGLYRIGRRSTRPGGLAAEDWSHLAEAVGGGERLRVLGGVGACAFCAGLLRPQVYVSQGLLSLLTPWELEAVLRHEAHHLRRRDPLRLFFLGLAQRLAAPLPVARALLDRVRVEIELAADRAALQQVPVEVLASALIKVAGDRPAVPPLAAGAGLTPDQARVAALLGRPVAIRFDARDALVSVLVLVIIGAVIGHLAAQPFLMTPLCDACPSF